jgi:glucose-1-phosphate thymidylyltransferase
MAGKGTRLRPHTHVTPKPLLPILGASMVERIVQSFIEIFPNRIEEAVFILGDFPHEVNEQLSAICAKFGIKAGFALQEHAQGTGHAIYCAKEFLEGEVMTVFADTLFYMKPDVKLEADIVAYVKIIDDPRAYGVVVRDENGHATGFLEKPTEIISKEALIGIYYIKEGEKLREKLQYMMDTNRLSPRGEYELPDAYNLMLEDGATLDTATVTDWLDCGTLPALLETTKVVMDIEKPVIKGNVVNSAIIQPVYIGEGALIENAVVGPYVSVEAGGIIRNAVVRESIVFGYGRVENRVLAKSFIGHHAVIKGNLTSINIGDHALIGDQVLS